MVYRVITLRYPFTSPKGQTLQAVTMLESNFKIVEHHTVVVCYKKGLQGLNPSESELVHGIYSTNRFDGTLHTFRDAVQSYFEGISPDVKVLGSLKSSSIASTELIRGELINSLVENTQPNEEFYNIRFPDGELSPDDTKYLDELAERIARSIQWVSAYAHRKGYTIRRGFRDIWSECPKLLRKLIDENLKTLATEVSDLVSKA